MRRSAMTFGHPDPGKLGITRTDGAMLVIYHPEPGTDSAAKLALLGAATAVTTPGAGVIEGTIRFER